MRALLFALTISAVGCGSKTEQKASGDVSATSDHAAQDNKATEAEQARGAAKLEAANAKEAADSDAAKAHKIAHDKLQSDFDASDRKFNALKEKAANVTGAKKKTADTAVAEVTKREATVMASIAKLRDATGATWDSMKTQVEADTALLGKAIDALETTVQ